VKKVANQMDRQKKLALTVRGARDRERVDFEEKIFLVGGDAIICMRYPPLHTLR